MRFYLSSRLSGASQVRQAANLLCQRGWTHTCDWTQFAPPQEHDIAALEAIALQELAGIRAADVVIVLSPQGRGTHIELGMAVALGKRIYLHHEDDRFFKGDDNSCALYFLPQITHLTGPLDAAIERIVQENPSTN